MVRLEADLDHVLSHTKGLWDAVRGKRVFITGGSGFFGCWLLESFLWANERLELGASAAVLTRDPVAFRKKAAHLADHPNVLILTGDVRTFEFPKGPFSHVIHAATETDSRRYEEEPVEMFDTIVAGTRRALDFARHCGAESFLLTSSGAVYGPLPSTLTHVPEEFAGAPDPTVAHSAYGEGKRAAETLCALYARQYGLKPRIARCFAFVGPYLPLDRHFAIGNFIQDALAGGPIRVSGDGSPYRSYLHAADLAVWLWSILLRGEPCRPYNVGADQDLPVGQVAKVVAEVAGGCRVSVAQPPNGAPPSRYVPSIQRAQTELGLRCWIPLPEAVARTLAFHRS